MRVIGIYLTWLATSFAADFAPQFQWVKTAGGSGSTSVAAATGDGRGNLYIVGSTTSLDFPVTGSVSQKGAGGSMLVRIDLATAGATRLFAANLPAIGAIAGAPSDPAILYAASSNQVFKSGDAGSTWNMVSQFGSGVSVVALAVDTGNSSIVYAAASPRGIYKSIDGGVTWTSMSALSAGRVWVSPGASNVIFAASSQGLMRSADAGNTWALVGGGSLYSTLAFDPFTAGVVYFSDGSALFRSSDNGQTFVRLSSLPDQAYFNALAPDLVHTGVLYAGTTKGIYQSSDSGGSWILKAAGVTSVLVADPSGSAIYANLTGYGIVKSTDGFTTTIPVGPNEPSVVQLIVSGPNLFEVSAQSTDAFVVKLDSNGNIVYSTYFGGSGNDAAVALAVGSDGSVYVTGLTNSADLPVTAGAYLSTQPTGHFGGAGFLLKLNPDGSRAWSTYFTETGIAAIAVDVTGNPYIAGATAGGLPTTAGAYQTSFQQTVGSNGFFSTVGPLAAFVTKFNAQGTGLVYSTYISMDNQKNTVTGASALAVDAAGNVWIGVALTSGIVPPVGTVPSVVELNSTGSQVVASAVQAGLGSVTAIALDAGSNVYVAGSYSARATAFPATPGAFQATPQPVVPALAYQGISGGGQDAFVAKWDSSLTHLLGATLLGGELPDVATSVAVDSSGNVIVGGYTDSKTFPTHAPFALQFSLRSGFVAVLDSSLSNLLFSTYLGDGRSFAAYGAVPDGSGNILLAGSTLTTGNTFVGGDNGASYLVGSLVVANKITLVPAPSVRLDSVLNYASHIGGALARGEPVRVLGAGFVSGAQVLVDGSPIATVTSTANLLVGVMPDSAIASGVHTVQVSSNGVSNSVYVPAAAAAPGIYSVDGSGEGQGYILNNDGSVNSPSNPAAPGSAITIFMAGAGQYTLSNGYAVAAETPAVFVYGIYCDGIAATIGPVQGLPGNVYRLSVYIPNPAVKFPAQSSLQVVMGSSNSLNFANSPMVSQSGVFVSIQ